MQARSKSRLGAIALGAAGALFGLLPWLVQGAQLPLQNLWGTSTMPADMPFALLPFSQYYVPTIAAMLVVGAAIAGLTARAAPKMRARGWWVVLGVVLIQVIALAQTSIAVLAGLDGGSSAELYFRVLFALFASFTVLAAGVVTLCAIAPPAGMLIGIALAAVLLPSWLLSFPYVAVLDSSAAVLRWAAPIAVGVAICIVGVSTAGRILATAASLLLLWLTPAIVTGVSSALGSRAILSDGPSEALDYGFAVFRAALFTPDIALPPVVVAAVIAIVGLTLRYTVFKKRAR